MFFYIGEYFFQKVALYAENFPANFAEISSENRENFQKNSKNSAKKSAITLDKHDQK